MASLYYELEDGTGVLVLENVAGNYLLEPVTGDYTRFIQRTHSEDEDIKQTVAVTAIAVLN